MAASASREDAARIVPRYAQPSIASVLPEYSNAQQEAIRAAFLPNNFRTISSLNRQAVSGEGIADDPPPFKAGVTGATTFSDFTYVPSPFDLSEEAKIAERLAHHEKMRAVASEHQPFFAGYGSVSCQHQLDLGYEYMSDPYEGPEEAAARERWTSEGMHVSRPFVPPGVQKVLGRQPTRAMLGDAMTALYRSISEDWPESPPTVLSTAEDLVVIYFPCEKVKSDVGVLTYMNHALRRNTAIQEFGLRKVPGAWCRRTNDGHYMFALRPPWVKAVISVDKDDEDPLMSGSGGGGRGP